MNKKDSMMNGLLRRAGIAVLAVVFVALITGPLWAILYISRAEQAQYEPHKVAQLQALSYGPVMQVSRQDMPETLALSGRVISDKYLYQELDLEEPSRFRQEVSYGAFIQVGDVLGYCNGQPVVAEISGILTGISLGNECYMRVQSLTDVALECYVDEKTYNVLSREGLVLTGDHGVTFTVQRIEPVATAQGFRVLLHFEGGSYIYGDSLVGVICTTGRMFPGALVLTEDCVYQKEDGKYYVRLTDQDGRFLQELEVTKTYSDGKIACVSGVGLQEGMYCDSGYKLVVESGGGYAKP